MSKNDNTNNDPYASTERRSTFILNDLKQSGECFGLAYLQIKYSLGYAKAVRVLNYIITNNTVKEGNYGSLSLKAPDEKRI